MHFLSYVSMTQSTRFTCQILLCGPASHAKEPRVKTFASASYRSPLASPPPFPPSEFLEKRPMNWPAEGVVWRVVLSPSEDFKPEEEDESELLGEFLFMHTDKYPEEAPLFKIRDLRGLREWHITEMTKYVAGTQLERTRINRIPRQFW